MVEPVDPDELVLAQLPCPGRKLPFLAVKRQGRLTAPRALNRAGRARTVQEPGRLLLVLLEAPTVHRAAGGAADQTLYEDDGTNMIHYAAIDPL